MYYYVEPNIPIPLTSNTLQPKTTSYVLSPSLSDYIATPTPITNLGKCFDLNTLIHLIIGSCLTLNLNYSGCCVSSLSQTCRNNGCYCDQSCYDLRRCCSDIAEIGCFPVISDSTLSTTTLMRITTKTGETLLPFTSSVVHPASTLTSFTTDSPSTMVLPTLTVTPGK